MNLILWIIAVLLILTGIAGTLLPALPGVPLIFTGVLIGAWIDDFQRISFLTVAVMAILTIIGSLTDYAAAAFAAQRVGASRQGTIGAIVGTIAGLFTGIWGLLIMPLAGAFIGEFIAHQDVLRAGKVGTATWLGLLMAVAVKLAVAFAMVGLFIAALLI